jgi:S1-C subfamily serine protease
MRIGELKHRNVSGVTAQVKLTFFGPVTSVSPVLGTGFAITYNSADYIVTNFHVVDGLINATVTFADGNAYRAQIVGSDKYADIVVLSVNAPPSEFHLLQLGLSSALVIGESVVAICNPYGLSGAISLG